MKPREVLGALVDNETSRQTGDAASMTSGKSRKDEDLRPWIENMKSWMRQRSAETDRLLERMRNDQDGYLASE
jgi:gluconate kinase